MGNISKMFLFLLDKYKIMNAIATIDISTPTGRKLIKELQKHTRTVYIEYPDVDVSLSNDKMTASIPLEEAADIMWKTLEEKFGYDLRTLEKV